MTKTEQMALERKAHGIEDRLEEHYRKTARQIGQKLVSQVRTLEPGIDDASEDEDNEVQEVDNASDWYRAFLCLHWPICLPSAYIRKREDKARPEAVSEAILRRGQLNQLLRALRGAINQKYFWVQSKQRTGTQKKERETYETNAKKIQNSINNFRRSYVNARLALLALDSSAADTYKELKANDVRIPSWMIELNSRKAWDEQNSWIWQEYTEEADASGGECK